MDYIWRFSKQDMEKLLGLREEIHNKEINTLQIKLKNSAQRLEELEVLIKKDEERKKRDEEEKQQLQLEQPAKDKKGSKKETKPAGKGGKKEEAPQLSPNETEKQEKLNEIQKWTQACEIYKTKLEKLANERVKLNGLGDVISELVDITGERKYVQAKLQQQGCEFLAPKGSYKLARMTADPSGGAEEIVELITLDGTAIRTIEEDEKHVEEPAPTKGKEAKKGAKKK